MASPIAALLLVAFAVLGAESRMLLSGAMPRSLAEEKVPSPLTLYTLERPQSNAHAVEKASVLFSALQQGYSQTINNLFVAWAEKHDREYATLEELDAALEAFAQSVEDMVQHNLKADEGHWRGLNKRSAYTKRELFSFAKSVTPTLYAKCAGKGLKFGSPKCHQAGADPPQFNTAVPPRSSHSWRQLGHTTAVTDIGDGCAAAWVHGAASCVDGAFSILHNATALKASRQSFLSCIASSSLPSYNTQFNSHGCAGGSSEDVYNYMNLRTVPTDYTNPYTSGSTGVVPPCATQYANLSSEPLPGINGTWFAADCPPQQCGTSGATFYTAGSADYTRYAVGGGLRPTGDTVPGQPIVTYWSYLNTSADPNGPCGIYDCDFINYSGGVFTGSWCFNNTETDLNHAMVITGFNLTADPPYWELQNSWGASWGEDGFIRVAYTADTIGVCGMYTELMGPNTTSLTTNVRPKSIRFNSKGQPPVIACSSINKKFCPKYPSCYDPPYDHCADP